MKLEKNTKILIVGVGLIGASYAQALTEKGFEVCGLDPNAENIDYCIQNSWLADGRSSIDGDFISQFDLIVFALYPHTLLEWIKENQKYIKSGALLTDTTGLKRCVVYDMQEVLREDLEFIGAHPMAGRESSGVKFADKNIFKGANYIVTPTPANTQEAIEACKQLGSILGFGNITTLTPEKHDQMIAFLSQLTHCIAVSLMTCRDNENLASFSGDSFRDLTRIAKINEKMWSELFTLNRDRLLEQMDLFINQFNKLRRYIAEGDRESMEKMMIESTHQRKIFDLGKDA
ncbi:MAG: prephenate dehydrogenase [Clostridia bacterium]|nr:prephenate dehydrogenase [Clostridia bacterium]